MFGLFSKYYVQSFPLLHWTKYTLKDAISEYKNTMEIKRNCQYCQSSLETKNVMYVGGAMMFT